MAAAFALLASSGQAAPAEAWRVERGDLRVACPLTVGGSFEARTASLTGTLSLTNPHPPAFTGELRVDLRTLDTGIALRSDHMRDEYLEVGKGSGFETAVLSQISLGDVDAETFQGHTVFTGTLQLHGTKNKVEGAATIRREGSSVRVEASFPVALADFGIPKPQYLGLGVKSAVQVKVALTVIPEGAPR